MSRDRTEPLLLTPGPLTTSKQTRDALLRDWGSRDQAFIELNARVRSRLAELAGGRETHTAIPLQGSGTFSVEAALQTFVPKSGKLLVLVNGAYGKRMLQICERVGIRASSLDWAEHEAVDAERVAQTLADVPSISHVAIVHCETTSGILNPVAEVAKVVEAAGKRLLIDSMSAFGALEISAESVRFDALMASSNKCLEGVPGVGFVIARKEALAETEGNARSLSMDLHAQEAGFQKNGQWRFTPPTHVLAAFDAALEQHREEGGVEGRGGRYRKNCHQLISGMRQLGFETLLPDELQAPIIVTFHTPRDESFDFSRFYDLLVERGFAIYPGKLTAADSFRMGCIGQVFEADIERALRAVEEALDVLGVKDCSKQESA